MALAGGTMRIDLDGEPAGTVTEIERQYAIEQLDARFPWWRKRA
jgi:sRNA-binding protein